ncbi:MAG: hypothetical protein MAG451_00066 [Anaerolineales bacterium]|nr:hypothetical protein [Anaerolineales bacterium]
MRDELIIGEIPVGVFDGLAERPGEGATELALDSSVGCRLAILTGCQQDVFLFGNDAVGVLAEAPAQQCEILLHLRRPLLLRDILQHLRQLRGRPRIGLDVTLILELPDALRHLRRRSQEARIELDVHIEQRFLDGSAVTTIGDEGEVHAFGDVLEDLAQIIVPEGVVPVVVVGHDDFIFALPLLVLALVGDLGAVAREVEDADILASAGVVAQQPAQTVANALSGSITIVQNFDALVLEPEVGRQEPPHLDRVVDTAPQPPTRSGEIIDPNNQRSLGHDQSSFSGLFLCRHEVPE